jgi:hypothetical protein
VWKAGNFLPFWDLPKESSYARCRAPVKIADRIIPVSQRGRNGDDALMLVVGQGYKYMDQAWFSLAGSNAVNDKEENSQKKSCGANDHCADSSNSFIHVLPLSTSRGRVPSGGPTMPSFSMMSIKWAARP